MTLKFVLWITGLERGRVVGVGVHEGGRGGGGVHGGGGGGGRDEAERREAPEVKSEVG